MFFRKAFRDCTGDYFEKVGVKMHCACPIYCGGYFAKDLFNEENLRLGNKYRIPTRKRSIVCSRFREKVGDNYEKNVSPKDLKDFETWFPKTLFPSQQLVIESWGFIREIYLQNVS